MRLDSESSTENGVEFYLNDKGEMFVHAAEDDDDPYSFFFTFTKGDWLAMKKFIDGEFGL